MRKCLGGALWWSVVLAGGFLVGWTYSVSNWEWWVGAIAWLIVIYRPRDPNLTDSTT